MTNNKTIFDKKKRVEFLIYGLGQGVNILGPLLVIPHIIAVCGQNGLGKIGVGFAMALILSGVVDYGSYINGVRDISINRTNFAFVKEKFKAIYLSKALLFCSVLFAITILIFLIPYFSKDKLLFFLSLSVVVGQMINPAWYLQGIENFKGISFANILSKSIYVACVFFFITKNDDYILANFFFGLGTIVSNTLVLIYIMNKRHLSFRNMELAPALIIIRQEFSFSFSQFFLSIYQYFPIIVISYIAGDFTAGQYRVIDQVTGIFKSYLTLFFYFVFSGVCFAINYNLRKGLRVWFFYNGANFLFVLILLGVAFAKTELILAYFKIDVAATPKLSYYFRIGLGIPFLIALSLPLRQLLFAFDKNGVYITITISATLLNIGLLYLMTKFLGLEGSLESMIITEILVISSYLAVLSNYLAKAFKSV